MPRGIGKLLAPGNPHVWDYEVSPSGNQPKEVWLKGRAIGGSSSINGMVYVRGAPSDYDHWASLGCTGWGWDTMGRHFVALEDHELGKAEWRGADGPLKVSVHPSGNPLCEAVLDAAGSAGTRRVADVNEVDTVAHGGMGYQTVTTYKGKRFSAARAFLDPVRNRPNLTIRANTDVLRIIFTGKRATGVMLRDKTGEHSVIATREIIVSAGAIQTPKLLQLSGIGPAALLQGHGIPIVVDAPEVGRNLREHRYLALQYEVKGSSLNARFGGWRLLQSALSYLLGSRGPLTHSAHEVGGFVKTTPELDMPDAQIGMGLYSFNVDSGSIAIDPFPGMTILGYFTRPESQGEIRIVSSDPDVAPTIDANHFTAQIDRDKAVALFRWLRELGRQPALKDWIVRETVPGPSIDTDEDILGNVIRLGGTSYHVCGTCRMGTDELAVLSPDLKVRGVEGLRVVDTSIMPTIVSGNTNAPAMAIAMNAAEMILKG
jgi:choline dehydrogenase